MSARERHLAHARILGATLALSAAFGGAGCGCFGSNDPLMLGGGGGAGPRASTGSSGSSVSTTAISTGAVGSDPEEDAGDPCVPKPLPPGVPEGWVENLSWSCKCRLYEPGSQDVMPVPIAWEPCPALPGGIDCRKMVTDWTDAPVPIAIGAPQFDRNPDGTAVLGIRRITKNSLLDIVADVDGPVRKAILRPHAPNLNPGCYLITESVNEGKYLFDAVGDDLYGKQTNDSGAIGGSIDDPRLTVLTHFIKTEPFGTSWEAGEKWIMRMGGLFQLYVMPWDMSKEIFVTSPATDPDGLAAHDFIVRGDAVFWSTATLYQDGINVWDPVGGTRPLIRWVGEYTKGANSLGTDGIDMVWVYGEGKRPEGRIYPRRSVMTSPFTTDRSKLKPRRLRKHPYDTIGNERFQVGCGYTAHLMLDQTGVGTMVIRLSDGVAWAIPHMPEFAHLDVLGVTCDEVFLLGHIAGRTTIARIRIDSLGPDIPPD